jgi:hypothetical protein
VGFNVNVDAITPASYASRRMLEVIQPATNGLISGTCRESAARVLSKYMGHSDQRIFAAKYEMNGEPEQAQVNYGVTRTIGTSGAGGTLFHPYVTGVRARKGRGSSFWLVCAAMALGSVLAPQARADFIGYYDFNNWTQASTSDGFAFTADNITVEMVGGNDGSGVLGTTTAVIAAPAAGTVQFSWVYNSLDSPTFDSAGYVLNGTYNQFADTDGETGTASFTVNTGDVFGIEVWTADNTGEPGIVQVDNFTAPEGADAAVPEPRTLPMTLLAAAIVAMYLRLKRTNRKSEGNA